MQKDFFCWFSDMNDVLKEEKEGEKKG